MSEKKEKEIIIRGAHPTKHLPIFFYVNEKKETENKIIYKCKSFEVASLNSYSCSNWAKNTTYIGLLPEAKLSKKEVEYQLLCQIEEDELLWQIEEDEQ